MNPVASQIKAWGVSVPASIANATDLSRTLRWFVRFQARELLAFEKRTRQLAESGKLTVAGAFARVAKARDVYQHRVEGLENLITAMFQVEKTSMQQRRRQGLEGPTALDSVEVPSLQTGRNELAQIAEFTQFATATQNLPVGAQSAVSPIPVTPRKYKNMEFEWLDKSTNRWASIPEIEKAGLSGNFDNLIPITVDPQNLLFKIPPATYEGPSGVHVIDGVETAILFDDSANVYYVPLISMLHLRKYMEVGGGSAGGSAGKILVGVVLVAAFLAVALKRV